MIAEIQGETIVYQTPDQLTQLNVRIEKDTVWLTQAQMVILFERNQSVISRHINNIFFEMELDEKSNMHFLHNANSDKPIKYFSLDVIISVGYRIKSQRGTQFRIWANRVLKDFIIKGYAINQRFERVEERLAIHDKQISFIINTTLPPKEGIFFDGQIFDAYVFVADKIKSAKKSIVLIDNYIDETVLLLLSKRLPKVSATIYTQEISSQLQLDIAKYNAQYEPVNIYELNNFHDRFLIIDDVVYHFGASLKDLGKKLFAFSKMEMKKNDILKNE